MRERQLLLVVGGSMVLKCIKSKTKSSVSEFHFTPRALSMKESLSLDVSFFTRSIEDATARTRGQLVVILWR
jgi:hypothetical protein